MRPVSVDPQTTARREAFGLWMQAPNPMVTFFKTLDVTPLIRYGRRHGYKFNMLLCWCIGRAASAVPEFFLLPAGDKMIAYDCLALSVVVETGEGGITTCDVPFSEPFSRFHADYLALKKLWQATNGEVWIKTWKINSSAITATGWPGVTFDTSGLSTSQPS